MRAIGQILFPVNPRQIPHERTWNVALRTVHIAVTGVLLGGHVFGAPEDELRRVLYLAIASGAGLMALGIYPSCRWFLEGRGVMVLVKLAVLLAVPVFWEWRVTLLMLVVVIASVGSHCPSRFRHALVVPYLAGLVREVKPARRRGSEEAT